MANICTTTVNIYPKKSKEMFDNIAHILDEIGQEYWSLTTFCNKFGLDIACIDGYRGDIVYYENFGDRIVIDIDTAWTPPENMLIEFQNEYPDIKLICIEDEPGAGILWTNDIKKEKYNHDYEIDYNVNGESDYLYVTEENLKSTIEDILKVKLDKDFNCEDIKQYVDDYNFLEERDYIIIRDLERGSL